MVYPKWLYHKSYDARIVNSKDEHEVLGKDWKESPAEFEAAVAKTDAEVAAEAKAKEEAEIDAKLKAAAKKSKAESK